MDTLALVILQTAFVLAVAAIALSGSAYYARAYVRKQMAAMQEAHEKEIAKLQKEISYLRDTALEEALSANEILGWAQYILSKVRQLAPEAVDDIMSFDEWLKKHDASRSASTRNRRRPNSDGWSLS